MVSNRKSKRIIRPPKKIGGCKKLYPLSKKAKKLLHTLPKWSLTNFDISRIARSKKIPGFRGVFMRDTLPQKPRINECAILNLDKSSGRGTHWVCYRKIGKLAKYFDSNGIGGTPPPQLVKYLKNVRITQNKKRYQSPNTNICGHLCLLFLLGLIN